MALQEAVFDSQVPKPISTEQFIENSEEKNSRIKEGISEYKDNALKLLNAIELATAWANIANTGLKYGYRFIPKSSRLYRITDSYINSSVEPTISKGLNIGSLVADTGQLVLDENNRIENTIQTPMSIAGVLGSFNIFPDKYDKVLDIIGLLQSGYDIVK